MKINRASVIRWKVYFDRSRMYIGYIQFFLIGVVFLESFRGQPWAELVFKYAMVSIPVLFVLFILLSLMLGYLDSKMGFRAEELKNMSRSNPVMMEILQSLKKLETQLEEIKKERGDAEK